MSSSKKPSPSRRNRAAQPEKADHQGAFPTIRTSLAHQDGRYSSYKIYAVHGLNSSTDTWTSKVDHFRWLDHLAGWLKANGGHSVDISLVGWNSHVISHSNISTQIRSDIRQLAGEVMKQYGERCDIRPSRDGPGRKQRIIFIGHSMGGILTRALLGWMHQDGTYGDFLSRVDGVILLASPSEGSALANFATPFSSALRSVSPGMSLLINPSHLRDLRPGSKELAEIGVSFATYCKSRYNDRNVRPLMLACLKETARERGVIQIVSDASGDVPRQAAPYVFNETDRLNGLSHTQVTRFTSQDAVNNNDNLRKIVRQFLRMQGVDKLLDQVYLRR